MPRRPIPISRAEAAAQKGCDKATITRVCRGPLAAAVLVGGDIDSGHPDYIAWRPSQSKRRKQVHEPATAPSDIEVDGELASLSQKFSSQRDVALHLKNRKTLAEAMRLESRNRRDDGRLISRAAVETYVFGFLTRLKHNFHYSSSQTIAHRVGSMAKSGASAEEQIKVVRDIIQQELSAAAHSIANVLKNSCSAGDKPQATKTEKDSTNDTIVTT